MLRCQTDLLPNLIPTFCNVMKLTIFLIQYSKYLNNITAQVSSVVQEKKAEENIRDKAKMKIWRKSSKGVIEDGVKVVDPIIKDVKATSCILFHDMITSDWAYCDV